MENVKKELPDNMALQPEVLGVVSLSVVRGAARGSDYGFRVSALCQKRNVWPVLNYDGNWLYGQVVYTFPGRGHPQC